MKEFIRPAKAFEIARGKIVYHHVSFGHELGKEVFALSVLHIQGDTLFTRVVKKEKDAIVRDITGLALLLSLAFFTLLTAGLPRVHRFDLNHVGPHPS